MTREESKLVTMMQQRIAELEVMQREYNAFLNYIVLHHGEGEGPERAFVLVTELMKATPCVGIKSEIVDNGASMVLRRIDRSEPTLIVKA